MMYEDIDGPLLLDEISNDTAMMNDHPFDSIEKEIDPHCEIKHKKKNDFNFTSLWRKPRISRRKSKSSSGRKSHHDGFFDENNFDDSSPAVQKTTTRKGRYVKDRESFETTGSIPLSDFDEAKDTIPFLNFRPGLSSRGVGAGVGVGVGVGVNGTTNTNSEASRILKEKTILNPKMFITPTPTKRKDIRSRISEGRMSSERVNKEESDDEVFKSISKNNIFNESPTLLRESPKNKYEIVDVVIKPTPKEEEGKEKDTICGKENLFQNTFYGGDLYQDHGPILSSLSEDSVYSDSIRGERFLPFDKHLDADPTSSNWNHSNDDFVENDDDLWAAHDINMSNHSGEEVQQQPKVEEVPNAEPASIAIETNVTSFSDRLKFYQSKTTSPPAQPVQHPNQNKKWDAHETNNSKLPTSSVQLSLDGGSISDHVDLAFDTFLNLCSPKEAILVETGLEEISEKPSDTAVTGHPIQTSTKAIKDGIFGVNDDKCTNVDSKYSFSKSTNSRREDRQDLDLEREVDTTRAEQPSSVESPTMIDTNASYIASCSLKGGRPSIDSPKILAGRRFRRSGNRFGGVVSRTLGSKAEGSAANKFREDEVHGEGEGDGIDIEQNLYTATTEIKDNTTVEVERASTEPKNEPESNYLQAKCNTSKSELHSESNSFQSSGNIHQRANVFGVTLKKRGGYQGKVISKTETPKTNDFVENEGSVEANDSILKTVNPSAMKEATTPVADEVPVESESKKNIHNLERSCKSSKNKRSHNISSLANIDQEILEDCAGEKLETINADIQLFENAEAELIAAPRVKANKTASLESQKKMAKVDIVQKQSCKLGNNTWKRRGFEERAASIESKTSEDKEHVINMRSNGSSALLETDATSNPTPTLNKKSLATNIVQNNASKFGSTSLKQRGFKARNIPLESRISSDNRDSVIDMESGATTRPSSVKETRRELGPSPAKNEDITDSAVDKKSLDSEEKDPDIQVSLDATKNLHCSESPRTSYVQQKASKFGVTLVKRRNFNVKQVAVNTGSTAAAVGSSGNMHYQNDMNQSAAAKLEIATVDKNVKEETNPESIKEGRTELGQPRVNSRSLSSVGHRINSKNLPSPSKQHDIEGVDSPNPQLHHIPDPRVEHVSPRKEFKSISISERMKMFERANTSNYANPMQSRKDIIQKKAPTSNLCEERDDIDHACGESPKSIESSGSLTSEDPTVSTKRRSTISKIEPGDDDELKILLESETLTSSIPTNNEYENDDVVTDYDRNGNRRMTLKKDSHMENNGTDLGFCEQKSFKQLPPPSPRRRVGHSARRHFFENLGGASREKSHFSRPLVKQDQVVPTNATSPKELEKAPSPYSDNLCETDGPPMFVTVEEDFMLKDNISTCLSASENRSVVCKPPDALLLSVSRKAMTLMSSDDGKKVPKISLSSTLNNATKEANHYDSKRKKQLSRTLIMHRHESKRTNEITTSQQYRRCLERKATSEVILKSEKQEISNMEKDIIQEAEDNNNNSKAEIYRPTVSSSLKARHDIFQSKVGNKCSLEKRQEAPSANNAASELRKVPSSLKARRNVFESKPMDPADRGKRSSFGESTVENKSRKSTTSSRKSSLSFEDVMKARRSMDSARTSSASYSSESVVRPSDLLKKVSSASAASGPQSPLPYRRGFSSTSAALRSSSTGQEKKQQHLRCF
jgi:hypothetical protein